MAKGYAEGPAAEEADRRREEMAEGVSDSRPRARLAVEGCTEDDPVAPAADAGLLPGDRIVAFNGEPVATWDELVGLVRDNRDGQAVIRYERDGETRTATTSTTVNDYLEHCKTRAAACSSAQQADAMVEIQSQEEINFRTDHEFWISFLPTPHYS